ncbi:MAG: protein-L-isoaspartate(D-aspartate) O-methyltransferase [Candidatus Zixiibacteriota bacterium]|nr:MAG: protein-L-isoaspartate(D-aspartate) O-methyltransferase [candidate division Zixibacteria bacterium]
MAPACMSADDSSKTADSANYDRQRRDMVESQIRARGISDPGVLDAMLVVERHLFVPGYYRKYSYTDGPLPIGKDQTISQPYIVALMTELLDVDSTDKVLEIGTGSGYQAAILGELADSVFTIEIIPELAEQAEKLLEKLGYTNIFVRCGDGFVGWEEHAPYDGIIVTCAPTEIPEPLLTQLAEGGRLVIPVGTMWQELILVTKTDGETRRESVIPVRFVPMTGEAAEKK